jgi:hypothetical protein
VSWFLFEAAGAEQRMRELIGIFTDNETLDELGIGRVHDAFPPCSSRARRRCTPVLVTW